MIAVSLSCIIFLLLALLLYLIDEIFFLIGNNTLMEWVHVSLKPINILDDLLFFFYNTSRILQTKHYDLLFKSSVMFIITFIVIKVLVVLFALHTYLNIHETTFIIIPASNFTFYYETFKLILEMFLAILAKHYLSIIFL
jgi:hypothetical protein